MENSDLISYINSCQNNLITSNALIYEASFFKIYVKFEKYLATVFSNYCIGIQSSKDYLPERKLMFIDEEHLNAVLKGGDKHYIDYIKKIEQLSKHIFIENPFNIIFEVADNLTAYNQMIVLRNHIAHESAESKSKYTQMILGKGEYIDPGQYLMKKNKKTSQTNYSFYIRKITEISELIIEKPIV
ncbi:MAG TPA: hypothetical protein DEP72_06450 [Clostridiales bacterium]|nr:MAG: hypothetical protein A2Y18_03640 [Clostridiales bacterium GWD2_32_19]HCC07778.1 hypothetical protein [Clostridiales bacterium]